MPRTPIYVALLNEAARAVMGLPHPSGRAALRMLEEEGFYFERYIDIFDGGPTVTADTDDIRTIRESHERDGLRDRRRRQGEDARRDRPAQGLPLPAARASESCPRRAFASTPKRLSCSRSRSATKFVDGRALMPLAEINFDGIVGPSHNYAGLSLGNVASMGQGGQVSQPRAAALEGIEKMRANLALGLAQGVFLPHPRPHRIWLRELGTEIGDAEPSLARRPCPRRRCGRPMPPRYRRRRTRTTAGATSRSRTSAPCRTAATNGRQRWRSCSWRSNRAPFAVHAPVPPAFGDEGAANHMRLAASHGEPGVEIFVYGVTGGAFPARQHLQASKAISRLHQAGRANAVRRAVGRRDRCRRISQRRRRGRQRTRPVRARTGLRRQAAADRRLLGPAFPASNMSRSPPPTCRSRMRCDPICSTRNW